MKEKIHKLLLTGDITNRNLAIELCLSQNMSVDEMIELIDRDLMVYFARGKPVPPPYHKPSMFGEFFWFGFCGPLAQGSLIFEETINRRLADVRFKSKQYIKEYLKKKDEHIRIN